MESVCDNQHEQWGLRLIPVISAALNTCNLLIRGQAVIGALRTTIWGINMSALSCVHYDWRRLTPGVSNATCASSFYVAHPFAPNDAYAASQGAGFDSRTRQHTLSPITTKKSLILIFCFVDEFCMKIKSHNLNLKKIYRLGLELILAQN
jgi:hypothetical protein